MTFLPVWHRIRALLLPLGVGATLVVCGGRQSAEDATTHVDDPNAPECTVWEDATALPEFAVSEATDAALPPVSDADETWQRLVVFSHCTAPTPDRCASALEGAEQWYESLRNEAQTLFIEDEAPDADTVREWTEQRRAFFERWLSTPVPVLRLYADTFVLSAPVFDVFDAWAECADDSDAQRRWAARSMLER